MAMRSEYTVIRSESEAGLIRDVTEHCRSGWHPVGGLAINKENTERGGIATVFYQALTREDPVDVAQAEIDRHRAGARRRRIDPGIREQIYAWDVDGGWKEVGS